MQKNVVIMLTHRCNLNCIYCYQKYKTAKNITLEIAKQIVDSEVQKYRVSNDPDGIRFDLFGGEPFLMFDLIKILCNYIWGTTTDIKTDIYITTNGTLLDDDKKQWLKENNDKIHIIMSVDGKDDVQEFNRGCHSSELPINYIIKNLKNVILSMTVSKPMLNQFADNLIYFHQQGYNVDGKLAQGEDWQHGDGKIYEAELEKIAQFYLENPEITPIYLFKEVSYIHLLNNEPKEKYAKVCGALTEIVAYDVDGKMYPCHHFLPNVNGRNDVHEDLKKIDFTNPSQFIDYDCMNCDIIKLCRSCCARNYNERGDVSKRDRRICQMMLAEAKVISSFQIRKYIRDKDTLSPKDMLKLKAAIKCYQLCCDFEKTFYKK